MQQPQSTLMDIPCKQSQLVREPNLLMLKNRQSCILQVVKVIWTSVRIPAAPRPFISIRQVAPMCVPPSNAWFLWPTPVFFLSICISIDSAVLQGSLACLIKMDTQTHRRRPHYVTTSVAMGRIQHCLMRSKTSFVMTNIAVTLFCSLAVLDPRVDRTMDILSPFIPVFCHPD